MRCSKCNGCISSFDEYRPDFCKDEKCPQGAEMPEEKRNERDAFLRRLKDKVAELKKTPKK